MASRGEQGTARLRLGLAAVLALAVCATSFAGCVQLDKVMPFGSAAPKPDPGSGSVPVPGELVEAVVQDVLWGDTIVVDIETYPKPMTVVLAGADAPDNDYRVEAGSEHAAAFTSRELPKGTRVYLQEASESATEGSSPFLYVWRDNPGELRKPNLTALDLEEHMLNAQLLSGGYALFVPDGLDADYAKLLEAVQGAGRKAKLGVWSAKGLGERPEEYVGNAMSGKFHRSTCESVKGIPKKARVSYEDRTTYLKARYTPCRKCWP